MPLAFKGSQRGLPCALLARWEADCQDPWLILTDLPPAAREAGWYGLRAWIEQGFKITKRAGWQWQRTRMSDPARAARLWLAIAVATLWLLSVGGEADQRIPPSTLPTLTTVLSSPRRSRQATRLRLVSVFRQGWIAIMAALLNRRRLPIGRFVPEPWPSAESSAEKTGSRAGCPSGSIKNLPQKAYPPYIGAKRDKNIPPLLRACLKSRRSGWSRFVCKGGNDISKGYSTDLAEAE